MNAYGRLVPAILGDGSQYDDPEFRGASREHYFSVCGIYNTQYVNAYGRLVPAIHGDGSQYEDPDFYPSSGVHPRSIIFKQ